MLGLTSNLPWAETTCEEDYQHANKMVSDYSVIWQQMQPGYWITVPEDHFRCEVDDIAVADFVRANDHALPNVRNWGLGVAGAIALLGGGLMLALGWSGKSPLWRRHIAFPPDLVDVGVITVAGMTLVGAVTTIQYQRCKQQAEMGNLLLGLLGKELVECNNISPTAQTERLLRTLATTFRNDQPDISRVKPNMEVRELQFGRIDEAQISSATSNLAEQSCRLARIEHKAWCLAGCGLLVGLAISWALYTGKTRLVVRWASLAIALVSVPAVVGAACRANQWQIRSDIAAGEALLREFDI